MSITLREERRYKGLKVDASVKIRVERGGGQRQGVQGWEDVL